MVECERCGDDVARLFEHRIRTETMTHRRTRRVCADCHPSVSAALERDRSGDRVVTDGGTPIGGCPTCSGTTVLDGDGVRCLECGWRRR